mmetsp:Transcript_33608/g.69915  ORF Transcript_33608/g.69915 Transcript_33608/m.69915 type:complete len:209 (+) Transcript_33608:328-954(+)
MVCPNMESPPVLSRMRLLGLTAMETLFSLTNPDRLHFPLFWNAAGDARRSMPVPMAAEETIAHPLHPLPKSKVPPQRPRTGPLRHLLRPQPPLHRQVQLVHFPQVSQRIHQLLLSAEQSSNLRVSSQMVRVSILHWMYLPTTMLGEMQLCWWKLLGTSMDRRNSMTLLSNQSSSLANLPSLDRSEQAMLLGSVTETFMDLNLISLPLL